MDDREPDERYRESLERSRQFLDERGIRYSDAEADGETVEGYRYLMQTLDRRFWEWRYESGGRGFKVSAHKQWQPSTTFTLSEIEGETLTDAFTRVVAEALKQDDVMGNRPVDTQTRVRW